ncbi:sugar phosphate nucleotidyltransferase [Paenibacillus abyssi]|uniref:Glucose-1-phosphate thymidylyltransferase n=1 Tax=Paenibacillus abyssi TaxID=1340531 RepID=A0A917FSQ4_9BACL|nr:sugar phosphate nucleotidyltransferase [Paenibacillus abyssi]GGF98745.1 glucose-1-phosphate thymidylyltransferase [Paenibacillus abyssi]
MKGLILCAGKGTRLYPLTRSYPKTLIPVANIPILQTCIEKLTEQNITDIGIVISPSQERIMKDHIGTGEQWGLKLTYIYQHEPKGIADAVKQAEGYINKDSFLLLLGDNLITDSLAKLMLPVTSQISYASLMLTKVDNPHGYGIAEISDHRIVHLEEKPLLPRSNLAVLGAYAFHPLIFKAIAAITPSKRGEYEITDAIQWLINQGHPVPYHITEKQNSDIGTLERWLEANRWMLEEMSPTHRIHETCQLDNCDIIPPVAIAQGCRLKDCVIGPYVSIGADTNIEGCHIENSILLNQTQLKNIPYLIKDTVVGFQSVVAGLQSRGTVTDQ